MKQSLKILADRIENGKIIKSCRLAVNGKESDFYFAFAEQYKEEVKTDKLDAWLILLIHKMMAIGGDWFIEGRVSKSLLDNLERYCAFWYAFKPNYKRINLIPSEEIDDSLQALPNKAIMTFSGGIDSCFTLYRHCKHLGGRNNKNIEQAVFIKGADIESEEDFKIAAQKAKEQCTDLGVNLILAETNFRKMPHDWGMEHLNVIVGVLNLFANYPQKIIASSVDVSIEMYCQIMPFSTNLVTDKYLASNNAPLLVDDEAYTRTQKAAVIKDWEVGLKNLRVCWQGEDQSSNCGQCEKCMRTMFNFLAVGAGEISAFSLKAYQEMDKNIKNIYTNQLYIWQEVLGYAEKNDTLTKEQLKMLDFVVSGGCAKKKHHSFWWHLKRGKF